MLMTYTITHEMAIELLYRYLEKIYMLDKHKGKSSVKVQHLYELNQDLKSLIQQMKDQGHNVDIIIREIKEKLEKRFRYEKIEVYVDGAARGNNNPDIPNISGIAFAVYGDSQLLYEKSVYLGDKITLPRLRNESNDLVLPQVEATNNVAEYIALIESLDYLLSNGLHASQIHIYSDSNIVVSQVNMTSATRAEHLIRLRNCAQELMDEFDNIVITHIPREQNYYVDDLVNRLLDSMEVSEAF